LRINHSGSLHSTAVQCVEISTGNWISFIVHLPHARDIYRINQGNGNKVVPYRQHPFTVIAQRINRHPASFIDLQLSDPKRFLVVIQSSKTSEKLSLQQTLVRTIILEKLPDNLPDGS